MGADQTPGVAQPAPPQQRPGLIDTDILIDAAHGIKAAIIFLDQQRQYHGIRVSVISAMELVVGSRNQRELRAVQAFLASVAVLPVPTNASAAALHLMQTFCLTHGLLIPDALIAATALESDLLLFTRNSRHFHMIPGLAINRPY